MKKLLNFALIMAFSMALLTGCSGDKELTPQATPTPKPVATPAPDVKDEMDEYTYQTVLILWKDVDGYWVDENGDYVQLGIDTNGKAFARHYLEDETLNAVIMPTSVMASNKLTYVVESELPAIENNAEYPGFVQTQANKDYIVDINGIDDGYFGIEKDGVLKYYVFAGEEKVVFNFDKAMKTAKSLAEGR